MRTARTMCKQELVAIVAEKINTPKTIASNAIEAVVQAIIDSDKTVLKGFGVFQWRKRPARTCRNPKTGETISVPESETLHFKPSVGLKNL